MAKNFLIVNPGSASKKYALFADNVVRAAAHFEQEKDHYVVTFKIANEPNKETVTPDTFNASLAYFLAKVQATNLISRQSALTAVGIRVVAPGTPFTRHQLIDQVYEQQLQIQQSSAPLHINPLLAEIEQLHSLLPAVPIVAVSDSAFHATIPEASRHYAIPFSDTTQLDLHRFGYHGISIQSLLPKIKILLGHLPARIIACHLGGGSSITAIQNGRSLENSMGYTPLEGLIMATRVGNIDAGALIKLTAAKKFSLPDLERYLNTQSGLLGLSELSADVRQLLYAAKTNPQAQLALDAYVLATKKYIGAYFALLNGLDLLVFTATIGERSSIMRSRICDHLDSLGIYLNQSTNDETDSQDAIISTSNSPVKIAVITTDEMQAIAHHTKQLVD